MENWSINMGVLISVDLSQIEILCFAQCCRDKNLIQMLKSGQDMHKYTAAKTLGKTEEEVTKEERKDAKAGNFGIIYGNGAYKLAQTTGRSEEWCKEFIDTFYALFPQAKLWHNYIINEVNRVGQLRTLTGRILKFTKYPSKYQWQLDKGIMESYNPPDIKNWPVQSLAGDIYKCLLGDLYREYMQTDKRFLLVNTIHDSIMFDCPHEEIDKCIELIKKIFDTANQRVYNTFKVSFEVPIKYDVSAGDNWAELITLNI